MKSVYFAIATLILLLSPVAVNAVTLQNPLDVSKMDKTSAKQYLEGLAGQSLQVTGIMKDASEVKIYPPSFLLYEIPIYSKHGNDYVKYGYLCQKVGSPTVIFAEDGYLSLFVKKNAVNKLVLATGKLINVKHSKDLPKEIIFLIESLNLKE